MTFSWKGDDLVITVKDARTAQGTPSQSGKMTLVETTHGFTRVPDSDLRVSLNLGRSAKA